METQLQLCFRRIVLRAALSDQQRTARQLSVVLLAVLGLGCINTEVPPLRDPEGVEVTPADHLELAATEQVLRVNRARQTYCRCYALVDFGSEAECIQAQGGIIEPGRDMCYRAAFEQDADGCAWVIDCRAAAAKTFEACLARDPACAHPNERQACEEAYLSRYEACGPLPDISQVRVGSCDARWLAVSRYFDMEDAIHGQRCQSCAASLGYESTRACVEGEARSAAARSCIEGFYLSDVGAKNGYLGDLLDCALGVMQEYLHCTSTMRDCAGLDSCELAQRKGNEACGDVAVVLDQACQDRGSAGTQ